MSHAATRRRSGRRPGWALLLAVLSIAGPGSLASAGPASKVDTDYLTFGSQLAGTTSAPLGVTLTNVGDALLTISSVSLTGANPGSFALVSGGGSGTLDPGASRTFSATFTPVGAGYQTAVLTIVTDTPGSPQQVYLSGTGVVPAPAISLIPGSLDFGLEAIGTSSAPRNVIVTNTGSAPLTLGSLSISGPNALNFVLDSSSNGAAIAPGASLSIGVIFDPQSGTTPGSQTALLVIPSNAPDSPSTVLLSGQSFNAVVELTFNPPVVHYGNVGFGRTSAPQDITVTNTGNVPLTIQDVQIINNYLNSFAITAGAAANLPFPPGASLTVSIIFSPIDTADYASELFVRFYDPITASVRGARSLLFGTGVPAPGPKVHLSGWNFGPVDLGTTSPPADAVLINNGDLPLTINSVTLSGPDVSCFSLIAGGGSGIVSPGGTRNFTLTFTPTAARPEYASLTVVDDAPGSPHTVELIGTGHIRAPGVSLSAGRLDFGAQLVGTSSAEQVVTLVNVGDAPLVINNITIIGTDPSSFAITAGGNPGTVTNYAGYRSIHLTFNPSVVGPQDAILTIDTNAYRSPHQILLMGVGTRLSPSPPPTGTPALSFSATHLAFGAQRVGTTSAPQSLTVSNTGTAPLTISGVSLAGANPGDFAFTGGPGTLAPGASQTYSVTFAPAAEGGRSASLVFTDNAGGPHSVLLDGTGVLSSPAPPPGPNPSPVPTPTPAPTPEGPVITGYAATQPRGVAIFSAPPGAPLLVLGRNLGAGGTIAFNGLPAAAVASWSPTEILVTVPVAAVYPFRGPVTVTVSGQRAGGPDFIITLPAPTVQGSDWPVFMHDPRQLGLAGQAFDPRGFTLWSVTLGSRPGGPPVVRDNAAYIGTAAGDVFGIDLAAHAARWQRPLPAPVHAALAAAEKTVVVSAGGLYGLSTIDGSIVWQRPDIAAEAEAAPMLVGSTVYLGARAARGTGSVVYAVNAATGADMWPVPVALPAGVVSRGTAAAYPELGLLLVGLGPAADAARPGTGGVMALRLADGSAAWPAPVLFPDSPAPAGLSLGWVTAAGAAAGMQPAVFFAAGSRVAALNAVTGAALWSRTLPETALAGPPVLSSPAFEEAVLYVGGASGRVYALRAGNGADAAGWSATFSPITGTPALAGDLLFVPTADGLVAADARTGTPAWSSPLPAATGVALAGGSPYLGTTDTRFVGFSAAGPAPPSRGVHDVAITRLEVAPHVSRQADAVVNVTLTNRGTGAEACELLLRVQPGRVVVADEAVHLAAGATQTVAIPWPTSLMGEDGPKELIAELFLQGAADSDPANNQAIQLVTVGP